jgi:radical SAM protein with 4Fe4S-binding SPASM domain
MLAELLVSLACNYSCPYCFIPKEMKQIKTLYNLATLKEILRCLKRYDFSGIDISGGEPFLLGHSLIKTIDFAITQDLKIRVINTNGTIFNPKIVSDLTKIEGLVISVGLDAATPTTYRIMRHSDYFQRILFNIQSFVNAGLKVYIGVTVTKINYKEIDKIIELAKKLGAEGISIGGLVPLGEGRHLTNWCLSKKEIEEVYQTCKRATKKIEIIGLGDNSCPAGIDEWCVLPNGDLYPCALLINFSEAKVGNIREENPFQKNKWLEEFKNLQPPLKCQRCHLPSLCNGACKAVLYSRYYKFPQKPILLCAL